MIAAGNDSGKLAGTRLTVYFMLRNLDFISKVKLIVNNKCVWVLDYRV